MIPNHIQAKSSSLSFLKIHKKFSDSKYGRKLGNNIRYSRYKPQKISNQKWEKILGDDVNNLRHMLYTYYLARDYLKLIQLRLEEYELVLFAALTHDWGEAVVGDVIGYRKDKSIEIEEIRHFRIIFKEIVGNEFEEDFLDQISDIIIFNKYNRLSSIFNSIERVGYLLTAIRSWKQSKRNRYGLRKQLQWLTSSVLISEIPPIIKYTKMYKPVKYYFDRNYNVIKDAFENMPEEIFQMYDKGEKEVFEERYYENKKLFKKYTKK